MPGGLRLEAPPTFRHHTLRARPATSDPPRLRAFAAAAFLATLALGACAASGAGTSGSGAGAVATPAGSDASGVSGASPNTSPSSPVAIVSAPLSGVSGSAAPGASPAPGGPSASSAALASPVGGAPGPTGSSSRFGGGLLIADRGNGRLIVVDATGRILWRFPVAGSLPPGEGFAADDAFVSPDGRTIVANDEAHQMIWRIDIATRRVVWQYGTYGVIGSGPGHLHTPDDAYPLANGDVTVADIGNCRILEISPDHLVVRQWGRTGVCVHDPPFTFNKPNGDTPLPDGGMLVTEIHGSWIDRLDASGKVVFVIRAPVAYPSDAQLDAQGHVIVADYHAPGAIVAMDQSGTVLWRYGPSSGPGALDHPSLALPLADGTLVVNDDFRHRVVVFDPGRGRIVWQYGHLDQPGAGAGYLFIPDGVDVLPATVRL